MCSGPPGCKTRALFVHLLWCMYLELASLLFLDASSPLHPAHICSTHCEECVDTLFCCQIPLVVICTFSNTIHQPFPT